MRANVAINKWFYFNGASGIYKDKMKTVWHISKRKFDARTNVWDKIDPWSPSRQKLDFILKKMLGPSKSWTYYNTARPPLMETCHQVTHKYHNKVHDACYDPFRSWALNHRMKNVHILRRTMSNYTSLDSSNENSFHALAILFYWTDESTNLFFRYFVINEIYNLYIFFFVAKLMFYSFNSFRIIFY